MWNIFYWILIRVNCQWNIETSRQSSFLIIIKLHGKLEELTLCENYPSSQNREGFIDYFFTVLEDLKLNSKFKYPVSINGQSTLLNRFSFLDWPVATSARPSIYIILYSYSLSICAQLKKWFWHHENGLILKQINHSYERMTRCLC